MNQKISLQDLAELLSNSTGQPVAFSENFIKELLNVVAESLISGENVSIKGLGDFTRSSDSSDKLRFIPAATFAEQVNAPFSHFMPEKLRPELTESDLESVEEIQPEVSAENDNISVSAPVAVTEDVVTEETSEEVVSATLDEPAEKSTGSIEVVSLPDETTVDRPTVNQPIEIIPIEEDEEEIFEEKKPDKKSKTPEIKPVAVPEVKAPVEPDAIPELPEEEAVMQEESRSSGFGLGFLIGCIVGLAVGAAAMFFYAGRLTNDPVVYDESEEEIVNEPYQEQLDETVIPSVDSVASSDSDIQSIPDISPAEKEPAPASVNNEVSASRQATDKVKAGYLMPKMAQKHYGNQVFWVYIYEENKAKISNPNNLPVGLELVIPAPEKYGIDANDSKSVARAQAKEKEIWNKK